MKLNQVAAQLFTLRHFLKTPEEIASTLKRVKQIGYDAVQVSGLGKISEEELMKILDGEGLICCATHEGTDTILNEPQKVVDRLHKLKCFFTAIPSTSSIPIKTLDDATALARRMDAAGKVLADAGMTLTYHNHHFEFLKIDHRTMLDIFYEQTNPQYLQGEIDTYWVQYGGYDPVAWCKKLKNRLPLLHMKDYKIIRLENEGKAEFKPTFAEIGQGSLNWPQIISAAGESGCQWYIVEQDVCPGDPFDSLKMSLDYIKARLLNS